MRNPAFTNLLAEMAAMHDAKNAKIDGTSWRANAFSPLTKPRG